MNEADKIAMRCIIACCCIGFMALVVKEIGDTYRLHMDQQFLVYQDTMAQQQQCEGYE